MTQVRAGSNVKANEGFAVIARQTMAHRAAA
jgi:hypothetical protein